MPATNGSNGSNGSTNSLNGHASIFDIPIHSTSTQEAIQTEHDYAAHNYHPLPVVISRGEGVYVWDPEGNKYLDFLSAYSAVNQGHCHPRLLRALTQQASRLTLSSRAFHNDVFPTFSRVLTSLFNYSMVLPMNTGAEAVETGLKLARKWAYKKKGVSEGEAIVICATGNFHGRTMAAISLSEDPESRVGYAPYLPGIERTIYGDISDLESIISRVGVERIAAVILEPIQGEAGIVVPPEGYLPAVSALAKKHNFLFIADEIQTGIARTGAMLAVDLEGVRPDVVLLGKALSGGMYPVSAILADKEVMLCIEPGTHGSTYGGNPLGCAVAIEALRVVIEEGLIDRARILGERFRAGMEKVKSASKGAITIVRGRGLLNAVVIDESKLAGRTAWDLCLVLKDMGLLAKPTHENIIRLAPPLVISEEEIDRAVRIFGEAVEKVRGFDEGGLPEEERGVRIGVDA